MSTIKVNKIENTATTAGGVTIDSSGHVTVDGLQMPTTGALSNRNLIINGAMQVAQRGTSTASVIGSGYYTVDRFQLGLNTLGTYTLTQESDGPEGFSKSFKIDCTTADASPASSDFLAIYQHIEAQDLQQLGYGTSSAKPLTLTFYVKSNKTGNASFEIQQPDNSDRQVCLQYSINAVDTWEKKTLPIPADTSGLINDDNGSGLRLGWWLNSGSDFTGGSHQTTWTTEVNTDRNASNLGIGGSTSDYWQITGVQLEVGAKATPYEHRAYSDELQRCQRYFEIIAHWSGSSVLGTIWSKPLDSFTNCWTDVRFKVTKRAPGYAFGLMGTAAWSGSTPTPYTGGVDAIVFNAATFYYLTGGSSSNRDMAYVSSEL